jgi:hypothetical protein
LQKGPETKKARYAKLLKEKVDLSDKNSRSRDVHASQKTEMQQQKVMLDGEVNQLRQAAEKATREAQAATKAAQEVKQATEKVAQDAKAAEKVAQ